MEVGRLILILTLDAAAGAICWLLSHRRLRREHASQVVSALNLMRCALVSLAVFWAGYVGRHEAAALVGGALLALALAFLPLRFLLLLDRSPRRVLWALNREALALVRASDDHPLASRKLWAVMSRIWTMNAPELEELRDLLIWRYLVFWDPSPDIPMAVLREVRIDQLEREIWLDGRWADTQSDEATFLRGLHRTVGDYVARARSIEAPASDSELIRLADALAGYRRPDTSQMINRLLQWVQSGCRDDVEPNEAELPIYRLPDGAVTKRDWLQPVPCFGADLSPAQLDRLRAANEAAFRRSSWTPGSPG